MERRTPFSDIDLDSVPVSPLDECIETAGVELEEACLVVRGKHQGKTVEFMVGSLRTTGPYNGVVLIHRKEFWGSRRFPGDQAYRILHQNDEFRLLLDCELVPDREGRAYTIRTHDEQGF